MIHILPGMQKTVLLCTIFLWISCSRKQQKTRHSLFLRNSCKRPVRIKTRFAFAESALFLQRYVFSETGTCLFSFFPFCHRQIEQSGQHFVGLVYLHVIQFVQVNLRGLFGSMSQSGADHSDGNAPVAGQRCPTVASHVEGQLLFQLQPQA